jgi:peptidoglycan hydrolase-like protein with peptidoglycan-binding domain
LPVGHNRPERTASLDREGLTRAIQHHLKRVGCYDGPISGVWSPAVRQAMKAFTDRVNATLPVDRPDDVLLALVQNHRPAAACGAPSALVAGARKPHAPAKEAATSALDRPAGYGSGPSAGSADPEERMSLAGPPAKRAARARKGARASARAHRYRRSYTRAGRRGYRAYSGMPWWAPPFFSQ